MSIQDLDLRNSDKEPFVIKNQVYVLGNPIINAQTLDQLTYILDELGEKQPIVIINPEATTIPNFSSMLSNLIQNNRQTQPLNVTTDDKYRFKDLTDEQLRKYAEEECRNVPGSDIETTFITYQGLRARAQYLYNLETLCRERDELWNLHCANPDSPEGSERYAELSSKLIPEAQAAYDLVVKQLQAWDAKRASMVKREEPLEPVKMQQSSVPETVNSTTEETAINASTPPVQVEPGLTTVISENKDIKPKGTWTTPNYMKIPPTNAKNLAQSGSYTIYAQQQRDVEFEGKTWTAVPLDILLSLGIPLVNDGLPICYTDIGTFKRVGNSAHSILDTNYWYPEPVAL